MKQYADNVSFAYSRDAVKSRRHRILVLDTEQQVCAPLRCKLSKAACAARYERENGLRARWQQEDYGSPCLRCEIGKANAEVYGSGGESS